MTKPLALVTGGTRGIGQAIAERLASTGWSVFATGRRTASAIGDGLRTRPMDVTDEAQVRGVCQEMAAEPGPIRGVVLCAAMQGGAPVGETPRDAWQAFLDVNVTGAWTVVQHILPDLCDGASIVAVGSVASVAGFANRTAYCASKHALLGMSRALACELAPRRIRVNHLCLGSFDTPGLRALAAESGHDVQAYARRHLLGRLGEPAEAAAVAAFLLSDAAAFVTGASWTVDGGLFRPAVAGTTGAQSNPNVKPQP